MITHSLSREHFSWCDTSTARSQYRCMLLNTFHISYIFFLVWICVMCISSTFRCLQCYTFPSMQSLSLNFQATKVILLSNGAAFIPFPTNTPSVYMNISTVHLCGTSTTLIAYFAEVTFFSPAISNIGLSWWILHLEG